MTLTGWSEGLYNKFTQWKHQQLWWLHPKIQGSSLVSQKNLKWALIKKFLCRTSSLVPSCHFHDEKRKEKKILFLVIKSTLFYFISFHYLFTSICVIYIIFIIIVLICRFVNSWLMSLSNYPCVNSPVSCVCKPLLSS